MRAAVVVIVLAGGCLNHDLDGLVPEEQAILGCWSGVEGSIPVEYSFHTDHTVEVRKGAGALDGVFRVSGDRLEMTLAKHATARIFVSTRTISYVDEPIELTRVVCGQ
jgi:hypothetical protein